MIFSTNPYRVLGVSSDAGIKDVKKNISKLKAFAKIGKEMELDYNLSFLNLAKLDRTDDLLLKSENQLNLDKNKITNSLFWFADLSPIDAVALAHLIKGDISKAIEIFEKAIKSNEVTSKNYSSFNNLSTLLLLSSLDDSRTDTFKKDDTSIQRIKKALQLKSLFLSSTFYSTYCEEICKSVALDSESAQDFFTSSILDLLNKNFNTKEISSLFDGLDDHLKEKLSDTLTEAPLSNVKSHIDSANELIKSDEKSGSKVGKKLIKDTRKDFTHLKDVLGADDFQFQTLSDQLSNQIMQCGIVCFNSTGDDQDYLSSYKYALSIAIGDKTKERAKECVKHCEEARESADQNLLVKLIQNFDAQYKKWEDDVAKATVARKEYIPTGPRVMGPPGASMWGAPQIPGLEVPFGYAKGLFVNFNKPYLNLVEKYGEDNELVINIGTGLIYRIVNCAVAYMNEQINIANYSQYLFERQSDKIIGALGEIKKLINKISKIKGNKEAIKYKNETKRSLLDNLKVIKENESTQRSNEFDRLIRPKPPVNTNSGGCYIATMAYGDYDHPQVLELRRFRDEILQKSLFGRFFISCYYAVSPSLVEYLKHNHRINVLIKKILDNFINYILR